MSGTVAGSKVISQSVGPGPGEGDPGERRRPGVHDDDREVVRGSGIRGRVEELVRRRQLHLDRARDLDAELRGRLLLPGGDGDVDRVGARRRLRARLRLDVEPLGAARGHRHARGSRLPGGLDRDVPPGGPVGLEGERELSGRVVAQGQVECELGVDGPSQRREVRLERDCPATGLGDGEVQPKPGGGRSGAADHRDGDRARRGVVRHDEIQGHRRRRTGVDEHALDLIAATAHRSLPSVGEAVEREVDAARLVGRHREVE